MALPKILFVTEALKVYSCMCLKTILTIPVETS